MGNISLVYWEHGETYLSGKVFEWVSSDVGLL